MKCEALRDQVVEACGRRCSVRETAGRECNRTARDRKVARAVASARQRIVGRCGAAGFIPKDQLSGDVLTALLSGAA